MDDLDPPGALPPPVPPSAPPPPPPIGPPIGPAPSLVDRVKAILLNPREEWGRIDAEPATIGGIYTSYVVPLAAIPPVATFIGSELFGWNVFGIHFRPSLGAALGQAIVQYVLTLVGVYVLALVIDALAPNFDGARDWVRALKVAAYSATASWVAGIFGIFPPLAILAILGLYGFYLFWLGLPRLMRVPESRAVGYRVVVIVVAMIVFVVIGAIAGAVTRPFTGAPGMTISDAGGSITMPGMGAIDAARIDAAAKQAERAAEHVTVTGDDGSNVTIKSDLKIVPAGELQALLPAALPGGYARTAIESSAGGMGGIGGSTASATYASGDRQMRLEVSDIGVAGAFAALGSAFHVNSSKQDASGYEKTSTADGRMTTERWNTSGDGEYSTVIGNRFAVKASGQAPSIDALKQAVAALDLAKLESLAKG